MGEKCLVFCVGYGGNTSHGIGEQHLKMDFIPLTRANFDEHKKRIIKLIDNIQIDDLDPQYEMSMANGIKMGNHANKCVSCNVLHYLMAIIIDTHRLHVEK